MELDIVKALMEKRDHPPFPGALSVSEQVPALLPWCTGGRRIPFGDVRASTTGEAPRRSSGGVLVPSGTMKDVRQASPNAGRFQGIVLLVR